MAAMQDESRRSVVVKAKAEQGYDLFTPKKTAVTILAFLFFAKETRESWEEGRSGGCSQNGKGKKEGCERSGKECGIGVAKAASFLDIIYLSAGGPEEREKEGKETGNIEGENGKR